MRASSTPWLGLLLLAGCGDRSTISMIAADAGADAAARPRDAELVVYEDATPLAYPDATVTATAPDASFAPDATAPAPDAMVAIPDAGVAAWPLDQADDVTLYLNLGDSFGAGYNASNGNGYADLLCDDVPAAIRARFPNAACRNRAQSGADSEDVTSQALLLPNSTGDTVVTIYAGGNDFNDSIQTIISATATDQAIALWQMNMTTIFDRLRREYEDPAVGRVLLIAIATIHDPTDGLGTIPPQYDQGFCGTIQSPLFTMTLRMQALANLDTFNRAIADFASANGAILIDSHALYFGHGLNGPAAVRYIDTDCAHGTELGHDVLHVEIWRLLTGES